MALPKIELAASAGKADAIALAWIQDSSEKGKGGNPTFKYQRKSTKEIEDLQKKLKDSKHFFGKKNETSLLRFYSFDKFSNVVLFGLGTSARWTTESCRQAGAALFLIQRKERLSRVSVMTDGLFAGGDAKGLAYWYQAFCEGYWLAGYEYKDMKKAETDPFLPEGLELAGAKNAELQAAVDRAESLSEAVYFARSLGDRPGNVLTPTEFGKLVAKMSKEHGLKCTVWGRSEIEKEKMGLFLGVAKGSVEDPKFLIMEHKGGKKADKPVVLVGKGITFDSGGISLKPAARMEDMKYDMMGAAAVAGAMQAIADLKPSLNVVGIIAACENMPDGKAQKPGDVVKGRSGKTVEIINTDAEGRLILADALDYAQSLEPQAILDFATLTGAVVDALGSVTSGIMGTSPELIARVKESSAVTSERVWELPLFEEYEEDLKSNYADIKNSGIREAGSSKGGTFLKFFVDTAKYPWVHFDIAGAAYHRRDLNYAPQKFAAGVMVRLVAHLIENWRPLK